jgi:SAM-dependent methyltransferase
MNLRRTRKNWDDLAEIDAYWAILGYPNLRSGKWDEQEFFRTGEREIERLMATSAELGYPHGRDSALDFGCGVGRVTRALGKNFRASYGVDISGEMLSRANALNANVANCRFVQNDKADLHIFQDDNFDLIYSILVLQHLPSQHVASGMIREFMRILKPGGLLVFHVPTFLPWRRRLQPRRRVYALLKLLGFDRRVLFERFRLAPIQLIAVPEARVKELIDSSKGRILRVDPGQYYLAQGAESRNYWVTK